MHDITMSHVVVVDARNISCVSLSLYIYIYIHYIHIYIYYIYIYCNTMPSCCVHDGVEVKLEYP